MIPPNRDARLWLFDFDNTIAALEREVDWPGSRRELEAYLRAQGASERVFAEIPRGNLPLYAALHARWLRAPASTTAAAPANAEEILRRSSRIIEHHELAGIERAAPTPGAIDLLATLATRGAVAIIVTSNSSITVRRWIERYDINNLVRAVVGRDSMLALKPSPEMIAHAMTLVAIPAGEAVFVGDSPADFEAARATGLGFYGIASTEPARERLAAAGAIEVFSSPAALRIHLNFAPSEPVADADSK